MYNWIFDKEETITKLKNAIMGELESLLPATTKFTSTANYWIDDRHNVFADYAEDKNGVYLVIKLEIYNHNGNFIGDLCVYDTNDLTTEELERAVTEIVKYYYGE